MAPVPDTTIGMFTPVVLSSGIATAGPVKLTVEMQLVVNVRVAELDPAPHEFPPRTRQKYCVLGLSSGLVYVVAVIAGLVWTIFVNPESVAISRMEVAVWAPLVHVKTGVVLTPVAPSAGPVRVGAAGAPELTTRSTF